jgi:hypothetical protein
MNQRGERTWCPSCAAPELLPGAVPVVQCFLDLLPAWRSGQGGQPGFERSAVPAVLRLHGLASASWTTVWGHLALLERRLRVILDQREQRERGLQAARQAAAEALAKRSSRGQGR